MSVANDPITVTTTAGDWIKALDHDFSRITLYIQNKAGADIQQLHTQNPWQLSFDGTDDFVDIDTIMANAALLAAEAGSVKVIVRRDSGGAGDDTIWSLGDTNADTYVRLFMDAGNLLKAELVSAGTTQWALETDNAIATAVYKNIKLLHNKTEAKLFVNGALVPQTFTTSTDKTAWVSDIPGVDNARIGCLNKDSAGDADFFAGDIDSMQIFANLQTQRERVLVAHYDITEGTLLSASLTTADISGNGYTGTLGVAAAAPAWEVRAAGLDLANNQGRFVTRREEVKSALWLFSTASGDVKLFATPSGVTEIES
ncbi:LamG-like jellyroll fold domain-containing protein [Pararhizobium sp.]|uniref:LamG-like jellyroll fold domain-containing protein n=1 Tax=Pararhizobium sp. TaxID=1977563 RepID=UPI003D1522D3